MVGPGVHLPSLRDCAPERESKRGVASCLWENPWLSGQIISHHHCRPGHAFPKHSGKVSSDCKFHLANPAFFTLRGYFSLDRQLTCKDCICRVLFGNQFLWTFTRFVSSIRIPFVRHTAARPGQEALCKALKKKLAPFSVDNCKCLMVLSWWSGRMHLCTFHQLMMQLRLCVVWKPSKQ